MMDKEIWKDIYFVDKGIIYDYRGLYQASSKGRIKSLERRKPNLNQTGFTGTYRLLKEKILKPIEGKDGYLRIELCKDGRTKRFYIHRIIGKIFINNSKGKPQINHINGIKYDNRKENLEWTNQSENMEHAYKIKLATPKYGKDNHISKKIVQYNKQGIVIRKWDCMTKASKEIGIPISNISNCCNNKRKSAGGFIWRYADGKQ